MAHEYYSSIDAACNAQEMELTSGAARGARVIQVTNERMFFEVIPDRGMNLGRLDFKGIRLAWLSNVGHVSPYFFDASGFGWLRTFSGGALATCGLTQVGDPCVADGESLGLHGRIGQTPAYDVGVTRYWDGSDYKIGIEGKVREARVFGEFLELHRKIEVTHRSHEIRITDTVTNYGYTPSPLMILYHMNFGFPLVSPKSKILLPTREIYPYDEIAAEHVRNYGTPSVPTPGEPERVYYHQLAHDNKGWTFAAIVNRSLENGIGIVVEWDQKPLKRFVQWNMYAAGQYCVGLEPGNCLTEGRSSEKERGTLEMIEPGRTKTISMKVRVVEGQDELNSLEKMVSDWVTI